MILRSVVALVYAFLLLPMVVVVLAAFNAGNYFTLLSIDLIAITGSSAVTRRALRGIV
jgi:ABC-type spermidine/putrescine transport system permease subunit II